MANNRGKIEMDIPKVAISAAIEELSLSLAEGQYHALLGLIESLNSYVQETKVYFLFILIFSPFSSLSFCFVFFCFFFYHNYNLGICLLLSSI